MDRLRLEQYLEAAGRARGQVPLGGRRPAPRRARGCLHRAAQPHDSLGGRWFGNRPGPAASLSFVNEDQACGWRGADAPTPPASRHRPVKLDEAVAVTPNREGGDRCPNVPVALLPVAPAVLSSIAGKSPVHL